MIGIVLVIALSIPIPIATIQTSSTGTLIFQIHDDSYVTINGHEYVVHQFNATVHELLLIGISNITVFDNVSLDLLGMTSLILEIPSQEYYGFFLNVSATWNVTEDGTNTFQGSYDGAIALNFKAIGLSFYVYPNRNVNINYDVGVPTATTWMFGAGGSIEVFGLKISVG